MLVPAIQNAPASVQPPGRLLVRSDRETLDAVARAAELLRNMCREISAREAAKCFPIKWRMLKAPGAAAMPSEKIPVGKMEPPALPAAIAAQHARLLKQLQARVSFEFIDQPLGDAVDFIREKTGANVVLDPKLSGTIPRPRETTDVGWWIVAISGGMLALLLLRVLAVAIWKRRRPHFALRSLIAMTLLASVAVYGWVRYRKVKAAWDEYAAGSTNINLRVTDMSADLAFDWILRLSNLEKSIQHEAIFISTPEHVASQTEPRLYPVADLESMTAKLDPHGLTDLIKTTVYPDMWDVALDTSIEERDGILCVWQCPEMHAMVEHVLEKLREHAGERTLPISAWVRESDPWLKQNSVWLTAPVNVDLKNQTLGDVSSYSIERLGGPPHAANFFITYEVEPAAQATLVTYSAKNIQLEEALRAILAPLKLSYVVTREGIKIGSAAYVRQPNWVLYDLPLNQFGYLMFSEAALFQFGHLFLLNRDEDGQTVFQRKVEALGSENAAKAKR